MSEARQIEGMRAKLERAKRFRAIYQRNIELMRVQQELMTRITRENRRLCRALQNIAAINCEISSARRLRSYARKVLAGLGLTRGEVTR